MNYKRKKKKKKTAMNSHYTIKETHSPAASQIQKIIFHRRLSSPESHSTSTPTQEPRWARPKTYQDKPSEEKFEEVYLFYVIPECFPGQNQIEILLNYALVLINKILSQTPYTDYIQILQFSSETEFTTLILAPTGNKIKQIIISSTEQAL